MSAPFSPGDVVVCVDVTPRAWHTVYNRRYLRRLTKGKFYRVDAVKAHDLGLCLILAGFSHGKHAAGWHSTRFRKIEAPKSEIADRIRACKPVKVSA
jgi:hypothetical protein